MLFFWEEVPSKLLNEYKPNSSVENIFIEINFRSKKWLLSCSCNPNLTILNNHTQNINRGLDFYSSTIDKFIALGDFNAETWNTTISDFCGTYNLKSLIKKPTYFKRKTQLVLIIFWQIGQNVFKTHMFLKLGYTIYIGSVKIAPPENCPLKNCPLWKYPPMRVPPSENPPLKIAPKKITPKKVNSKKIVPYESSLPPPS